MISAILRNTGANYALKGAQMALGIASVPILVGQLGTQNYGILVLAGVLVGYFMFLDLGLSEAVTKYVAQFRALGDDDALYSVINTSLAIFALIGVFVAISTGAAVSLGLLDLFRLPAESRSEAEQVFYLAGGLAVFAWPRKVFEGVLQGLQRFVQLNVIVGLGRVLAVALAISAALAKQPLPIVFLAWNIDCVMVFVWLVFVVQRRLPAWRFDRRKVRRATFRMMWGFSAWLMLTKLAVILEYQIDSLVLSTFVSVAAITTYTVVMYPFRIIQQISGLAASAIMPAVSATHGKGGDAAVDGFRIKGARIHNAFVAMCCVTMLFILEPFIRLWMGDSYLEYLWLAQLACAFQLVWQSNAFLGQVYVGTGRSRQLGVIAIVTGVLNLGLSLVFVGWLGFQGVVIGTLAAGSVGVGLFVCCCLGELRLSAPEYLRAVVVRGQLPFIATGLLLLPLYRLLSQVSHWGALIAAAGALTSVFVGVFFIFTLDADDRHALLALIRREV